VCRLLCRCAWRALPALLVALTGTAVGAGPTPWSVAWELALPCDPGHFHFVETDGPCLAVCAPPDGLWMVNRETGVVAWRTQVDYACGSAKVLCFGDRALLFSGFEKEAALLDVPSGAPIWRRRPPPYFDWEGVWPVPALGDVGADPLSGGQPNRFVFLATEAGLRPRECRLEVMEPDGRVRPVASMHPGGLVGAYLGGEEVYLVDGAGGVHAVDLATGQSTLRCAVGDGVAYVLEDGPRICVGGLEGVHGVDPVGGRLLWSVPRSNAMYVDEPALAENCLAFAEPDGLTLVDTVTGQVSRVSGMRPLTWARPAVAGQWVYVLAKGGGRHSSRLWRVSRRDLTAQLLAEVKGELASHWLPL
jgi:hypothetical protein